MLDQKHIDWLIKEEKKIRRDYQVDKMTDDDWERLIYWVDALAAKAKGTPQEQDVKDWFISVLKDYNVKSTLIFRSRKE